MTAISIYSEVSFIVEGMKRIEQLSGKSCKLRVLRVNKEITVDSSCLVPSDVVLFD